MVDLSNNCELNDVGIIIIIAEANAAYKVANDRYYHHNLVVLYDVIGISLWSRIRIW